jgi:hypothetical protein
LASIRRTGGPLLGGSLLESQPQTGTVQVPALPVARNCPHTNVRLITGNVMESPVRDGQGISTLIVVVSPFPGGHDGLLLGGSLLEGGGSLDEGGGSLLEGGGSLLEGGGSLDDGGGSLLDGGSLDDGGSLLEGGGSLDDGGGSLLEGGSLDDGGSLDEDGSLLDGGSLDEDDGSLLEEDGSLLEDELDEQQTTLAHCRISHLQLSAQCLAIPQLPAGIVLHGNCSGAWTVKTRLTGRHLSIIGS